ncbi:protein kinase [Streptomyces sp. NPDC059002]|uniref:serine/threonine-protein kinase n=1 Tax=Streptomyces sp. NPDC059002 TaxID=3346690 RepID=UPI00367FE3CF
MRQSSPLRIGPYETLARLGAGGMGEVFLATRGPYEPDALVAVKAIRKDLAGDTGFRARFRRELAVAASVDSPYVARLVAGDADEGTEQPWLATEYVAGPTLAEAVRRHGPLPTASVAALGAGVARALAAVHTAGALHRDLKPANVLLGAAGPQLIDFGVARALGATTMTSTGLLVGTPGFMSPEHVAGGRHVVAASDVFCLASVLAYAATGSDPFGDGPVAAVLYRVSRAEARLDDVPAELRELLAPCLAREAGGRPGPEELAEGLAGLMGAGAGAADAPWPASVRGAIAEVRRDVAQLCAAGSPLLPLPEPGHDAPHPATQTPTQTPTRTPAAPGTPLSPAQEVHGLPTMSAAAPAAPRRRGIGRKGALATVLAVAVAGGAVGALLALRGPDGDGGSGGQGGSGGAGQGSPGTGGGAAGASPAELVARAGVDSAGTLERSGSVPQFKAQRPRGWKPWRATFGHAPMSCSADTKAVVCLLTNGTYEARSAVDGHRLWTSDGRSAADGDMGGEAYISPSGNLFMPGDQQHPVVRGGTAVIAYKGRVQVRDSASGKVRWYVDAPAGTHFTSALLTDERLVLAAEGSARDAEGPKGATLRAYPLDGGTRPAWTYELSGDTLAEAELGNYTAETALDGVVYANSKDGVVALREKKGGRVGGVYDGGQCLALMAAPAAGQILCTQHVGDSGGLDDPTADPQTRVTRLDAKTLAVKGAFGFKAPPIGADGHPGRDIVVSAVASGTALAYDTTGEKLLVADARNGRITRKEPLSVAEYMIKEPVSSPALLIGDRALTADNSTLRTVPLTAKGTAKTVRVPGAPGNRTPKEPVDTGTVIADKPKPPTVLPLGGVVTIVYDQGTVVSTALPPRS